MPVRLPSECCPKVVVSVSEMARSCGLSRSRFYDLVRQGVMPAPCYDLRTRRPLFPRELQQQCLEVKRSNVGIDGRFVIFYERQSPIVSTVTTRPRRRLNSTRAVNNDRHAGLIMQLNALGLSVTAGVVDDALRLCFPTGHDGTDEGELLRALWRHLRQATAA